MEWSDGYIADIPYTSGFYRHITPGWLSFASLTVGQTPPPTEQFAYAELGCGLGHGTALMAACYPGGEFWGFDFAPAQVQMATRLANRAELENIHFVEASFAELAAGQIPDLPRFDYIALHGIWSWVSAENRDAITRFISRYLKPGGMVYISYNVLAGWASQAPFQAFVRQYAETLTGASDTRFMAGAELCKRMHDAGAFYFAANPHGWKLIEANLTKNPRYLAHEYMNGSWYLATHAEVRDQMASAKCSYLGSATIMENADATSLPAGVREIVAEIKDPVVREMARDLARNQGFRRDIYVRGGVPLTPVELQQAWSKTVLAPQKPAPDEGAVVCGTVIGNLTGNEEVYRPLLQALHSRGRLSFAEAFELPELVGKTSADMLQAFCLLVEAEFAHPVSAGADADNACNRYNRTILAMVLDGHEELTFMASPILRTGIGVGFSDVALIAVCLDHPNAPLAEQAEKVWQLYVRAGKRPKRHDTPLLEAQEALPELEEELKTRIPAYRRLGLLPA